MKRITLIDKAVILAGAAKLTKPQLEILKNAFNKLIDENAEVGSWIEILTMYLPSIKQYIITEKFLKELSYFVIAL